MLLNNFIKELKIELENTLPGYDAHLEMMPESRIRAMHTIKNYDNARKSGVLILFYPDNKSIKTVFILRPEYDGVHSSQVAFPGGKFEEKDIDIVNTALREANEEVGIVVSDVEIIGKLSEIYIPPSNFLVQPVIGFATQKPIFKKDTKEVAEIIEVDIAQLLDASNKTMREIILSNNLKIKAPCYLINEQIIWGATAMIVSELIVILKKIYSTTFIS